MLNTCKWVVKEGARYRALPRVDNEITSWLTFAPEETVLPFTIQTKGNPTQLAGFRQAPTGPRYNTPFIAHSIAICDSLADLPQARYNVRLTDRATGRDLMNQAIHGSALLGTDGTPLRLHEPLVIPANASIRGEFTSLSAATQTMYMVFLGRQLMGPDGTSPRLVEQWEQRKLLTQPYWLTPGVVTLTNTTQSVTVKMPHHFDISGMTSWFGAGATCGVTITETQTRRTLMNGQILDRNGTGNGAFPFLFTEPFIVPAGSFLRFDFTGHSVDGAAIPMYLTLHGRSIHCDIKNLDETARKLAVPLDGGM